VSPDEASAAIHAGEVETILDVREPSEWAVGRIEGAIHMPLGQVMGLLQHPDAAPENLRGGLGTTLVYCAHGVRSKHAVQALSVIGNKKAISVDGGLVAWAKAGLPMIGAIKL